MREAWLWTLAIFGFANLAAHLGPGGDVLAALSGYNPIVIFAFAVIARCIYADRGGAPADRTTILTIFASAAALAVATLFRTEPLDGLVALGIGLVLLHHYRQRAQYLGAAIVFLAVSVNLFWARLLFTFLKTPILLADSALAEAALRVGRYEVVRDATKLQVAEAGSHVIMIIGACSAFNNISLAVLACVSILVAVRGRLAWQDIWSILAVSLVMLLFNTLRLALFAIDRAAYDHWHGGPGAETLALVQTGLLVLAMVFVAGRVRAVPA